MQSSDNQTRQAKPKRSLLWLLLIPAVSLVICLGAALLIPWSSILKSIGLSPGTAVDYVEEGTYENFRYTAPEGNFSCDFSVIMETTFNPTLRESINPDYGAVWANDDFGLEYAVDFFNMAPLGGEIKALLADPSTHQMGLEQIFENILLSNREQNFPGAKVTHTEFIEEDILFTVLYVPGRSNLTVQTGNDGVPRTADSQESDFIFVRGEWFYFVSVYRSMGGMFPEAKPAELLPHVKTFHSGCQFSS